MNELYKVDWDNPVTMIIRMRKDPQTFIRGRRNNDLVNWFLIMVILEPGKLVHHYIEEFRLFKKSLTEKQQRSLDHWDENWVDKIHSLYRYYGHAREVTDIMDTWIDQDYLTLKKR